MAEARVVITHGGPGTIMQARAQGKVPIVVPRQARFGEHVNDHQVDFCRRLEKEGLILMVDDIRALKEAISAQATAGNATQSSSTSSEQKELSREALCGRLVEYCQA